jgi:flagellar assembly protein FliH
MSDGAFDPGARFAFAAQPGGGFRSDARFRSSSGAAQAVAQAPVDAPIIASEDPLTIAFTEGFAAGAADAHARLAQRADADAIASERLTLSFSRLDAELEEQLRQRLRDTVAALCESTIAPLALDPDALIRRVERAVAMLARADDERLIRLHPDDISLLSPRFADDWQVIPDAALERGALRVETASGGVEDGPDLWRRAIAEALHQC